MPVFFASQMLRNKAAFLVSFFSLCSHWSSPNLVRSVIVVFFFRCAVTQSVVRILWLMSGNMRHHCCGFKKKKKSTDNILFTFMCLLSWLCNCTVPEGCPDYLPLQTAPPFRMEMCSPIVPQRSDPQTKWAAPSLVGECQWWNWWISVRVVILS